MITRVGLIRLVFVVVVSIAAASALFFLIDALDVVERRKLLRPLEIILYVVVANVVTLVFALIGFWTIRWVRRGFGGDDDATQD